MLYRRHTKEYRTKFIISSIRAEEALVKGMRDVETITSILNNYYQLKILDTAPYHYIVTRDGFFEIKSTDLGHNDNSFLKAFNDDIRILLIDDNFLQNKIEFIAGAIATASSKHSMPIHDSIVYTEYEISSLEDTAMNEIYKLAIKYRNELNPIMSIYEHVVENDIVVNKSIIPASNRNGHTSLKLIANKYMVPLESLKRLNGHVNHESLKFTDTIFLPNTTAISARNQIVNAKKESQFIMDRCRYAISKGVDLVG